MFHFVMLNLIVYIFLCVASLICPLHYFVFFCLMLLHCETPTLYPLLCSQLPKLKLPLQNNGSCVPSAFSAYSHHLHYILHYLGHCTIELVPMLDKVSRSKANSTPVKTICYPINCQCFLIYLCIAYLHLQIREFIMVCNECGQG